MIYRYAPYHEQQDWIRRGWRAVGPLPGPHARWSVLMVKLPWWRRIGRLLRRRAGL